ncbi:20305_t:CDS:2, partial [Funneliformis geosporum]
MSSIIRNSLNSQQKQQDRKKGLIWFHFIEGLMLNSSYCEAKCKYCFEKMGGIPANMLKHFKEDCSNIDLNND